MQQMDFPWLQIRVHELRQKAAKGTGPAKAVVKRYRQTGQRKGLREKGHHSTFNTDY